MAVAVRERDDATSSASTGKQVPPSRSPVMALSFTLAIRVSSGQFPPSQRLSPRPGQPQAVKSA